MIALGALAAGLTGWLRRKTTPLEQALLIAAGLVLIFPGLLKTLSDYVFFSRLLYYKTAPKKLADSSSVLLLECSRLIKCDPKTRFVAQPLSRTTRIPPAK